MVFYYFACYISDFKPDNRIGDLMDIPRLFTKRFKPWYQTKMDSYRRPAESQRKKVNGRYCFIEYLKNKLWDGVNIRELGSVKNALQQGTFKESEIAEIERFCADNDQDTTDDGKAAENDGKGAK